MVTSREHIKLYREVFLHDRIKNRLIGSGFEDMFKDVGLIAHNIPLFSALIEIYDVTTKTFRIGQHNIFFGLEDVLVLTGLPISGNPVILDNMTYMEDSEEVLRLIGVPTYTENGDKKGYVRISALKSVVNNFQGDYADEEELLRACRAAALIGIHCLFNSDCGRAGISTKYLHLLKEVNQIKSYAWGAAAWVQIHSSILNAREKGPNVSIFGCLLALETCIFMRVPNLVHKRYNFTLSNLSEFPLMHGFWRRVHNSYNNHASMNKDQYIEHFENVSSVFSEPYKNTHGIFPQYVKEQFPLRASETICIFGKYVVPHQPQVVIAQLTDQEVYQEMVIPLRELPAPDNRNMRPMTLPKTQVSLWKECWAKRWENLILPRQINEVFENAQENARDNAHEAGEEEEVDASTAARDNARDNADDLFSQPQINENVGTNAGGDVISPRS